MRVDKTGNYAESPPVESAIDLLVAEPREHLPS
jgi:hypothetical protein